MGSRRCRYSFVDEFAIPYLALVGFVVVMALAIDCLVWFGRLIF